MLDPAIFTAYDFESLNLVSNL